MKTTRIVRKGSMKPHLRACFQSLQLEIDQVCRRRAATCATLDLQAQCCSLNFWKALLNLMGFSTFLASLIINYRSLIEFPPYEPYMKAKARIQNVNNLIDENLFFINKLFRKNYIDNNLLLIQEGQKSPWMNLNARYPSFPCD